MCYQVTGDTIPPICGYNAGQHIYLDAGADRFTYKYSPALVMIEYKLQLCIHSYQTSAKHVAIAADNYQTSNTRAHYQIILHLNLY